MTGKLKQALYKGVKQYKTSPEDWNIQRDMHQPMIARDDYEELQERANAIEKNNEGLACEIYERSGEIQRLLCRNGTVWRLRSDDVLCPIYA